MGNQTSIFTKTPEEYAQEFFVRRHEEEKDDLPLLSPPGFVRVAFWLSMDELKLGYAPSMEADVPLEKSGALRLEKVKKMWGLEDCSLIDPVRWSVFEPRHPEYLSNVAVKVLSTNKGRLLATEQIDASEWEHVSYIREQRQAMLSRYSIPWVRLTSKLSYTLTTRTPLPSVYGYTHGLLCEARNHFQLYQHAYQMFVCLLLFIFVVIIGGGFVDPGLDLGQRTKNWARTGDFSA